MKNIGLVNKENYQWIQEKYKWFTLNVPSQIKKPPSEFYCQQLKYKKYLRLSVPVDHIYVDLNDMAFKYLKCLTGIEKLQLRGSTHIINTSLNTKESPFKTYFPKLKHLELYSHDFSSIKWIPEDLTFLKIGFLRSVDNKHTLQIEEKIKEMINLEELHINGEDYQNLLYAITPILIKKENFKRLTLDFISSNRSPETLILFQRPETIKISVYLNLKFKNPSFFIQSPSFMHHLPGSLVYLSITKSSLGHSSDFCSELSKLTKLEHLILDLEYSREKFQCIFDVLPNTLTELFIKNDFDLSILESISLPAHLKKIEMSNVKINFKIFEAVSRNVEIFILDGEIVDPQNILQITEPFENLKTLVYEQAQHSFYGLNNQILVHLYSLLPERMNELRLVVNFENSYLKPFGFEKKILQGTKQFDKEVYLTTRLRNTFLYYNVEYKVKGNGMIKTSESTNLK